MKPTFVLSTILASTVFSFVTGCASTAPVQPAAAPREERVEPAAKITPPPSDDFIQYTVTEKPSKKADKKKDADADQPSGGGDAPSVPAASMRPEKAAQGKLQFQR